MSTRAAPIRRSRSTSNALIPWRTLTGRQHFYLDHENYLAWGEHLPTYKPRPDHTMLDETQKIAGRMAQGKMLNYITPHGKWSIHSTYSENDRMMTLSRGGYPVWLNDKDAAELGIADNDWVEVYNDNGVFVQRAIVSARIPAGTVFVYHATERTVGIPKSPLRGKRAGMNNSLTRARLKPVLMTGGYAQFTYAFNYWGPTGVNRDTFVFVRRIEKPSFSHAPYSEFRAEYQGGTMNVRAHMSMLFHLDKCIGCHTCSVACKNLWTDRKGAEYMWWNNVETRPGTGYPTQWENQKHYHGGWELKDGKLQPAPALQSRRAGASCSSTRHCPALDDYYEPFTFRYQDLFNAPAGDDQPTAIPISKITGEPIDIQTGPNWDDDLGGSGIYARNDPSMDGPAERRCASR